MSAYRGEAAPDLHYCAYPDRPNEPTLCGLGREPDSPEPADAGRATTTVGPDVTCDGCRAVLDGAAP